MSEAWDTWLAECLSALDIDADVYGPYVTGIMVRRAAPCRDAPHRATPRVTHIGTIPVHAP